MHTTDEIDQHILKILREDARTPLTEIAKRIGRSRTAVQTRIEKLEAAGTILGYTTVEPEPEDQRPSAIVTVYLHERLTPQDVLDLLSTYPEVRSCHRISGDADLLVTLCASSHHRTQEICKALWAHNNVRLTETLFVLETVI